MLLLAVITFFCISPVTSFSCGYCTSHEPKNASQVLLKTFCNGEYLKMDERCCYNKTNAKILGIDLSNCELKSLNGIVKKNDQQNLQWLAVNSNPLLHDLYKQLRDFQDLYEIIVSDNQSCNESFNIIHEKGSGGSNIKTCSKPKVACNNVTCPAESTCQQNGPGLSMCSCNDGWNSYRCLKKNGFPAIGWLGGFIGITAFICVTLRALQHNDLKKGKELKSN